MLTRQVGSALQALHTRAFDTRDGFELDRIERALDELVRNPNSNSPARFQFRSVRANAAKVVHSRRLIIEDDLLRNRVNRPGVLRSARLTESSGEGVVDILTWLETTPSLNSSQRQLLLDLAAGEDAVSIAARDGLPVARVQERISRARNVGWNAFQAERRVA